MVPIFCRTSYLKAGKVGYLHTASGDTPALEYRRLCSSISKLVTSRFFLKWCSSGVVSAFPFLKTIDFTGFSGTFQDTAVADEKYFYHISYILSSFWSCSSAHRDARRLSGTFFNFCFLPQTYTILHKSTQIHEQMV